jgi:dihydroorotase-like cyclic amidohydrolase
MSTLIKNVFMVNEGNITLADLRIKDGFIEAIGNLLEETDVLLID